MKKNSVGKTKKIDKRRLELEQWKKQRQEAKELLKKITKPPFRPVGKASLANKDYTYTEPYLQKSSIRYSRLQTTTFNRTSNKITSTPFNRGTRKDVYVPKSFKKVSPLKPKPRSRRNTFDREQPTLLEKVTKLSPVPPERKSAVHFKENMTQIIHFDSPVDYDSNVSPESVKVDDDIRRVSNAGRTPFSCTESRSGSTPGRRDYPSSVATHVSQNDTVNELFGQKTPNKQNNSRSAARKRLSQGKCLLRWSVPRKSIIERDPYLLRSRTPINTPIFNSTSFKKLKQQPSQSSPLSAKKNSQQRKTPHVSFGKVIVNTIPNESSLRKSSILNDTINLLQMSGPEISSPPKSTPIVYYHPRSPTIFPHEMHKG